jgi:hypothetical protein
MNRSELSKTDLDRTYTDIGWFVGNSALAGEALRGGDIAIAADSDFVIRSGVNEIVESLKRRLSTPRAFYERWILDVDGLSSIDSDYGNPVFGILSEPMTSSWLRSMLDFITLTVNQEDRVNLIDVSVGFISPQSGSVTFVIEYKIIGSDIVYSMQLESNGEELLLTPDY